MDDWPHAPPHRLTSDGTYFVTAGTYLKRHYYRRPADLDRFVTLLFGSARDQGVVLQAWCVFSNHYHLVVQASGPSLRAMLALLHSAASRELNKAQHEGGRRVWYQYRDTLLTYERSWLARLKYTHENAVKHGLVRDAVQYRWCSAASFARSATPAFLETLARFRLDRIQVADDFDVERPGD
jgi:putative transposase